MKGHQQGQSARQSHEWLIWGVGGSSGMGEGELPPLRELPGKYGGVPSKSMHGVRAGFARDTKLHCSGTESKIKVQYSADMDRQLH